MSIKARIERIEKSIRQITASHHQNAAAREQIDLLHFLPELAGLPPGTSDEEAQARTLAEEIIKEIMAGEDPHKPHYPNVWTVALADRFGIDLLRYAANEKHAEAIRRSVG